MIFSENKVPYDASTMRDIEEGLIIAEGEKPKFIQKNITENGTYRASSDNVDGYSSVVANVPNTYSLSDEGKVVNEGNLVAQSAYPTEITKNDTYDTTNYNSITVNVSGGTPSSNISDVNFYDYDGTLVASYTAADFANLAAMPANPTHEGLTAQGWNWSLSDAKNYVANNGMLNIGQMYITSDGKTRFYYVVPTEGLYFALSLTLETNTELDIDWGDDSEHTIQTNEGEEDSLSVIQHEYSTHGQYVITITVIRGSFSHYNSYDEANYCLRKVEIGNNVNIGYSAFQACYSLSSITIPNYITSFGNQAFYSAVISTFTIPSGVTSGNSCFYATQSKLFMPTEGVLDDLNDDAFSYLTPVTIGNSVNVVGYNTLSMTYSIVEAIISNSVKRIDYGVLNQCSNLISITIPDSVTDINHGIAEDCNALSTITFESTTPPFANFTVPYHCVIRIPEGSLSAYTSADNYPDPEAYIYEEY